MDELQQLRASVAAATWNRQASLLLAAVSAAQAAATAQPQLQSAVAALHPQQEAQQQQQQPALAASTAGTAEQPAGGAPLSVSSSPQLAPAAAQPSVPAASAAAVAQSATPQQEQEQEQLQLSLWQRIAAAEAAAAEAAERAEAELPAAAAVGATYQSLLKQDQQQVVPHDLQPPQRPRSHGPAAWSCPCPEGTRGVLFQCVESACRKIRKRSYLKTWHLFPQDNGAGMASFTQLLREGSPDCTAQAGSSDMTMAAAAAQATAEVHVTLVLTDCWPGMVDDLFVLCQHVSNHLLMFSYQCCDDLVARHMRWLRRRQHMLRRGSHRCHRQRNWPRRRSGCRWTSGCWRCCRRWCRPAASGRLPPSSACSEAE